MSVMKDQIQKRAEEIGNLHGHGLTKLELFAAMAMQGLSGKVFDADIRDCDIVSESLSLAKSLCFALAAAELEGGQNG